MSLDVYLHLSGQKSDGTGIFIRENGSTREITRAEWDEKFPGLEPLIASGGNDDIFSGNITHNLNRMADTAGLYAPLWRPEEIGITYAHQLIEPLRAGLALLKSDPVRFTKLNPDNGWGSFEVLVEFVENYLEACKKYPMAEVSVSR